MSKQFIKCPQINNSTCNLLRCIEASSSTSTMHGYWMHSHQFLCHSAELTFWNIQADIIHALHVYRSLSVLLVHIHSEFYLILVNAFKRSLFVLDRILPWLLLFFLILTNLLQFLLPLTLACIRLQSL